ncbi:endo-1,4-beta-xylanase [Pedobacter sp. HDW13]|uniref:endo-1,4-beta-xylanase n=1 Tax=Pedobacter sp. HDW13 TaxID=2714940 RepID=UPI001408FB75|nr:endo-1,4-beta-xylanase [Pedobacter sp. HDW13]QIL41597.1 endo-1,4-beta-xylanase [Pedobacter sp. HDW13]
MNRFTTIGFATKMMLSASLLTISCAKSTSIDIPVIKAEESLQKKMPFPIGAALNVSLLKSNASYRNLVIKEFNSVTAENAMKFASVHPAKDTYTWSDADYLVDFARANGKRVHGHTLNWYQSLPDWVKNFQGSTADWEDLLKTHIQTVVGHFKGKVVSWDVVNEAVNEDGTLRNTIWLQKLGADYISRAFQYAHEADPDALLFYNDYGHEYSSTKRTAILNLVNGLKSKGIPIDGIGLQMHTNVTQTDANLTAAITTAAATGLKVHISEIDISLNSGDTPGASYTAALGEQQAAKYKTIVKAYNAIPKNQQFGITQWNVTDGDSWIPLFYKRADWPLPFDAQYQRKAAYQGILDGVK